MNDNTLDPMNEQPMIPIADGPSSRYCYAKEEMPSAPFYNDDLMAWLSGWWLDDRLPQADVVYVLVQDDEDHWRRRPWHGVASWDDVPF